MSGKIVRTALTAVVLVVGLSACSSADHQAPPAPTSSADPLEGSPSRDQGADQYEALVASYNEALVKCMTRANKVWDAEKASSSDLRQVRSACKAMPAANRQFADGLASSSWPSEAQESISLLVDEVRGDQLAWKELSEVSSEGKFFNPMNPLKEDTKTPDLVRAHLGLPAAEDIEESE